MDNTQVEEQRAERVQRVVLRRGSLRVITAGEGVPLVYLHGVGDDGSMLPILSRLAEYYSVVRPDHPGFLESDDMQVATVAEIAAVQLELVDSLGIDQFVLVGCSFGGWVAAELALLVPDRVISLTLIDAAGLAGDGSAPDLFSLSPEESLRATIFDPARRAAALAVPRPSALTERLLRSRAEAYRLASNPLMHDPTLRERLAALTVNSHIVWGAEDGIIPVAYAAEWAEAIAQSRVSVIEQAGHLPHVEHTEEFLARSGLLPDVAEARSWN